MDVGGNKKGVKNDINITPLIDVVLVLLIFFMIAVPMLMRQVVLDVPRKIDDTEFVPPDQQKQIQLKIKNDLSVEFDDGDTQKVLQATELATTIRPILDAKKSEKVVFVDFEDAVPWENVIEIMGTVRSLATKRLEADPDKIDYDEIKVALKVRENLPPP